MNQKFTELHEKAIDTARRFHNAEYELIDILQKIDSHKVFVHLGYGSLFDYATKALKLSESNASNFITVARKSFAVPELKNSIQKGEVTVSKARKIAPVLTVENASHWLKLAREIPKPLFEREVARVNPQAATPEKARFVSEDRIELRLGISVESFSSLKRARDIASKKLKRLATYEETLEQLLENYLERTDPVKKAERILKKNSPSGNDTAGSVPGTRSLTANQKHRVFLRDHGRCTHVDHDGNRCVNSRWTEIHHRVPLSKGGGNEVTNLTTLCSAHHKYTHLIQQRSRFFQG